jgi:hypothetical protein
MALGVRGAQPRSMRSRQQHSTSLRHRCGPLCGLSVRFNARLRYYNSIDQ